MKKLIILIILLICTLNLFGQTSELDIKLNDSISFSLTKTDIKITNQQIDYYQSKFPIAINGEIIFGTDGDFPITKLTKAILRIGKSTYSLETKGMFNPWFGNGINKDLIKIKKENGGYKLLGIFSDGAGSYGVEWVIYNQTSIRTILTKEEKILFEYFPEQ